VQISKINLKIKNYYFNIFLNIKYFLKKLIPFSNNLQKYSNRALDGCGEGARKANVKV